MPKVTSYSSVRPSVQGYLLRKIVFSTQFSVTLGYRACQPSIVNGTTTVHIYESIKSECEIFYEGVTANKTSLCTLCMYVQIALLKNHFVFLFVLIELLDFVLGYVLGK